MSKKLTVYQKLNNLLGPAGIRNNQRQQQANKYTLGNDVLLKTDDKAEYQAAMQQAQQTKYLKSQWNKVDGELYQNAIHYETTRVGSYADFESMEFYPEISAALDVMMEESTTANDKGRILNVYSESNRVKDILEDLFMNRLDIHTNLPMWTRNTCKYGDNFLHLNIDDKRGITGVKQLPNFEIERREGDIYGILNRKAADENTDEVQKTKFLWKGKDIVFNSWQIAHFRLLGDDRRLPYGTSVLEKARRIWKQLVLSEDAMLVYRVTRAPERRVYKVYVGNIDDADVGQYVDQIANKFKRSPITDPKTGQIDLRYNQLAIDQDIFVPVREEGAASPIDTLPGASNLDQIADIEYLQRKLFTALRVPKPFLGFEDTAGEGKNLALQDIRFSRTINRIQQSMIQEMNKIAIIHLYLLGFEDELNNFTITLNNPSTQADMLKLEHEEQKINLYKNAVQDAGNGFGAMSMTRAKKDILGWSEDEIRQDLIEQRMEKAASFELENTPNVIKHTGLFDTVDRLYGDMDAAMEGGQVEDNPEDGGPAGGGGGFGGGGGAGDLDFGDTGLDDMPDDEALGGDMAGDMGGDLGMDDDLDMDDMGDEPEMDDMGDDMDMGNPQESLGKKGNLITESKQVVKGQFLRKKSNVDILVNSIKNKEKSPMNESVKLYDKNFKINQGVQNMINEIDKKLGK
jgi:hypothetical protein